MDNAEPLSRRRAELTGSHESLAASSPSHSMDLGVLTGQQGRPSGFAQACPSSLLAVAVLNCQESSLQTQAFSIVMLLLVSVYNFAGRDAYYPVCD